MLFTFKNVTGDFGKNKTEKRGGIMGEFKIDRNVLEGLFGEAGPSLEEIFPTTLLNGKEVRVCGECGRVLASFTGDCLNRECSVSTLRYLDSPTIFMLGG